MKSRSLLPIALTGLVVGLMIGRNTAAAAQADAPENLARKALTSATSEHNGQYLAKFATDGKIPQPGSSADLSAAWCVLKPKSGDQADFTLEWTEPVEVSEIIYFGRTAWFMDECWKDYEIYIDGAQQPAAKGSLKVLHGPQRIKLPKQQVGRITIKFLNSHGGQNPGASEIMVFATSPTKKQLVALTKGSGWQPTPQIDEVGRGGLAELIAQLKKLHGANYAAADDHLARLESLKDAESDSEELAALQRELLLFDVDKLVVIKRHEINASHVYTYHYEGFKAGGGLYVVSTADPDAEPLELVATPDGQILDCDLSYDGRAILFSWRRNQGEGYHLWTINVDGSDLKQLTDGEWHDYNACWLPDGDIAFLTTRAPQFAYCWHAPVGILHRMSPDGTNFRQLSSNYLNDFTPQVLDDGRLIYSRWEYVDRPAIPIQSLWTINPDGTQLSGFFGNRVLSPGTFMEARSIPGTKKIICTMTGHNGPARGAIGVIDRSLGVNSQAAIVNITPDTPVQSVDKGNGNTGGSKLYSWPIPLDRHRFLLSAKGPVLIRTISGTSVSTAVAGPTDGMQYFAAQPIRPRNRPPVLAPQRIEKSDGFATIYLQDVYNGLEPFVKRGEVKSLRVVRDMQKTVRIDPSLRAFGFQFPVISCGATYAGKDVLGTVPIEADGSACFRVPAHTPIYFMALDAQGRAVQRMRSFTHLMSGEVQGCIGCHDQRRHASRPSVGVAYNHTPREITPPEWGAGGFDYARTVQPVLDRHCIECHDAVDPPKGIDLTGGRTDFFNVSYDVLARENQGQRGTDYVNWIPTYNGQEWNILEVTPKTWGSPQSKLAELLFNGHPDKEGKPRIAMDESGRRRILAWIDLNVPYYGTSETAYPDNTGCRKIYPAELDKVLAEVATRRCTECHAEGKIPRRVWTRVTEPELNSFLIAPLAKTSGGSEKCGKPVFATKDDPDYKAILATFAPTTEMLRQTPRMDMPGGKPSLLVSRSCQ